MGNVGSNRFCQRRKVIFVVGKFLLSPFGFALTLFSRVVGQRGDDNGRERRNGNDDSVRTL